jgi:hypothetical protein
MKPVWVAAGEEMPTLVSYVLEYFTNKGVVHD